MLLHAQSPSTEAEAVAEADNTLEAKLEATKGGKKKAKAKQQHRPAGGGHDRRTQAQLRAACAPIILALLPDVRRVPVRCMCRVRCMCCVVYVD
jgi:hypothetical protein